jgi:hypothetical protein
MKHLIAVLTEPTPGKQAEFDDYYENLHLGEVLATTGWDTAQRFVLTDEVGQKCPQKYLALYQVEADSAEDIVKTLTETRPQRQQSDALNLKTAALWVFSETGPVQYRPGS